jgi:hypothetical protein
VTKLDWRKAKAREIDPARQQPLEDFVGPDPVIVSITPVGRKELSKHLAKQNKERRNEAARWPSRVAAEARERERLVEEVADRARQQASRESRDRIVTRKKAAKKARKRALS